MKVAAHVAVGVPAPAHDPRLDATGAAMDGRTKHGSLLVVAPITKGKETELEKLLEWMAAKDADKKPKDRKVREFDLEDNPIVPFKQIPSVHFARLLILRPAAEDEPRQLLFATDFDGTLADHLNELLDVAAPGLDRLFSHCVDWSDVADRDRRGRFLVFGDFVARHAAPSNTFYTGTVKRSVTQICREAELRTYIEEFLDLHVKAAATVSSPEVHRRIRAAVFAEPRFAWVQERPGPFPLRAPRWITNHPDLFQAMLAVLAAIAAMLLLRIVLPWSWAIGLVLGVAAAVGAGYLYIRWLSANDPVDIPRDDERTKQLVGAEDHVVQNQLTTISVIKKPLWFRRLVLRLVLASVNSGAKFIETQGSLSGIPTIHFARWVVVDNGRRLLFFSNFDGSWQSYLGDFVDKAHKGLTAIWSNTVGFPRTIGLRGGGALDEQRFKAIARASQVATHYWYSAYKDLTVLDINNNTRLRLGLYEDMTGNEEAACQWLRMAAPRADAAAPAPQPAVHTPPVETYDVQGFVTRSYSTLKHAAYVPVSFHDESAGRRWLRELMPALTPACKCGSERWRKGQALNVAFTREGLRKLGLHEDAVDGFSREFIEGMAGTDHRQRQLGDVNRSAPARWRWGGTETRPRGGDIDAMVFVFAETPGALETLLEVLRRVDNDVTLHPALPTEWFGEEKRPGEEALPKEHFGFTDGIAQPRIAGLGRDGDQSSASKKDPGSSAPLMPAGEVILGYPNAYGKPPMSPTVDEDGRSARHLRKWETTPDEGREVRARDFGRNGSYVVFRQLDQDVRGLWSDLHERAAQNPEARKTLAAKMVGRWPNGTPLIGSPEGEPAERPAREAADQFDYAKDLHGDTCPVGAHIRRTNPRDSLLPNPVESALVSARHRLLRRGRTYGSPMSPTFDPDEILKAPDTPAVHRGLYFICLNTDIERQFEFVQNAWMNSHKFNGLFGDPDAMIAPHDHTNPSNIPLRCFTVQRSPVRTRHLDLKQYVTTAGGCYLFMPGFDAMRFLVDDGEARGGDAAELGRCQCATGRRENRS